MWVAAYINIWQIRKRKQQVSEKYREDDAIDIELERIWNQYI